MGLFDGIFNKQQYVLVVTKNGEFLSYFTSKEPFIKNGSSISPDFTGSTWALEREKIDLSTHELYSGIYDPQKQVFEIDYIAFFAGKTPSGKQHNIAIRNIAEENRKNGKNETCLTIPYDKARFKKLNKKKPV